MFPFQFDYATETHIFSTNLIIKKIPKVILLYSFLTHTLLNIYTFLCLGHSTVVGTALYKFTEAWRFQFKTSMKD